MARIVPLISAGAIGPILAWTARNDLPVSDRLSAVGLGWFQMDRPLRPIPLLPAVSLLKNLADEKGPDMPCRTAAESGVFDIGMLGKMALSAPTVRAALQNMSASMRRHCTHEILAVKCAAGDCIVSDLWVTPLEDEAAIHYVQQYVAAIVLSLVRLARRNGSCFSRICIRPHPRAGFHHLTPWFGAAVEATNRGTLELVIPASVADLPLPATVQPAEPLASELDWPSLRQDGTLAESVRVLVRSMIGTEVPSIDNAARYAGMSRRTFQRLLSAERQTFSSIVDSERRNLALERLQDEPGRLGVLAADLGYLRPGSLTRSFRRWTGETPSHYDGSRSDTGATSD